VLIQSIAGTRKIVEKGKWNGDWLWARFRQFGTFQVLVDNEAPSINTPP
jgi:hypothetical protein